ncbi:MAG: hypothetical protein HXL87_01610 [[Eubacterium] sulci]|nr:hypothetical protein [[Eubacterium] sulci]
MIKTIRFGAIPPNGKSINFIKLSLDDNEYFSWCLKAYGINDAYECIPEDCFESGVSAFEFVDGLPLCNNINLLRSLACRIDEQAYLLVGDKVGEGRDGEPLIRIDSFEPIEINRDKLIEYITGKLKGLYPNHMKDNRAGTDRISSSYGCRHYYNGYRFIYNEEIEEAKEWEKYR